MLPSFFLNSLQAHYLHTVPNNQQQIWIACSGGRDSMVLAHVAQQLYLTDQLPFKPMLIHVNHGLQQANDDWEKFVEQWAHAHNIPFKVAHANLQGTNEQAARQARYQAIWQHTGDGDVVMLAHHANDQAETMLMRLFQGAGTKGLSAMQAWTSRTIAGKRCFLWRPLLSASRQQITDYAIRHTVGYVDDPTNVDGDNIRAHFRSQLFPIITQLYPQAVQSMSRSSALCNDANSILTEVYRTDVASCTLKDISVQNDCEVLDIDQVQVLSVARQSQLIHRWVQGEEAIPPSYQRVQEVLALLNRSDNNQQTQLDWQGQQCTYSIRRYRQHLYRLRQDWLDELPTKTADIKRVTAALISQMGDRNSGSNSHDNVDRRYMRALVKDDKIYLNRNGSSKSGKKLMQSLAIPMWERESVQVVIDDNFNNSNVNTNVNHVNVNNTNTHNMSNTTKDIIAIVSPRFVWLLPPLTEHVVRVYL